GREQQPMPIKTYRPTTPTRRFQTVASRDDITKEKPEKSLTAGKQRSGGRNSLGVVSSRFRGGGAKKSYRVIDFKRDKVGIPARARKWRGRRARRRSWFRKKASTR